MVLVCQRERTDFVDNVTEGKRRANAVEGERQEQKKLEGAGACALFKGGRALFFRLFFSSTGRMMGRVVAFSHNCRFVF